MEPFIQLSYNEQCPKKIAKLPEIALVNKGKVPECFWLALLERKCPEGLGEVSEGLVNDENLTPADFLDDLNVSPDICASPQTKISNACCTDFKTENGDQFKTPVTSRYSHKITETPCLFSQDESTTCIYSPTSSLKSQPTGHGDELFNQAETSTDLSQSPTTPVALSRYKSGSDWSARRTTSPDILAEILGQREPTLSRLLAGGHEDEITEWSESMATPPLNTTEPAGDPSDGQVDGENTDEKVMGGEGQIPPKRIARVLFSGCLADQSLEAMELSLDKAKVDDKSLVPLRITGSTTLQTTPRMETADSSLTEEEFVMEYSCHDESKRSDITLSERFSGVSKVTLSAKGPPSPIDADVAIRMTYFSPPSAKPSLIHSPHPNSFLSPKSQSPFQVLAQSTPKQSFKGDLPKVINTSRTNDKSVTENHDTNLPLDTNMHNYLPDQLCDMNEKKVHCASGDKIDAEGLDHELEDTDVSFGSPSRSFELAMAREADKLCSGAEKDSRTSGLGSSLSVSLNPQSQNTDDELINSTVSQPTNYIQETAQIPRNGNTLQNLGENNITISGETTGGSLHGHGNYLRKRSFCKVPGIRRSARTKRFSYPSASQVAELHIKKSARRSVTNDDFSLPAKEENPRIKEAKGSVNCETHGDIASYTTLNSCDGNIELPLSEKLKFEEMSAFCKGDNALKSSPTVNSKEKDDVLYDMDALTQFPMESICSPPPGASRAHLEKEDVTESVKTGKLVCCDGNNEPLLWPTEKAELEPVNGNTRKISDASQSSAVAPLDEHKYPSMADEMFGEDNQIWENNSIKAGKFKITALHGPQISEFSPIQTDNCQYFGRFSPETKDVYVTSEYDNVTSVTNGTISCFEGFKTASGKHVSVSSEALEKAKATIKEIDELLGLCEGDDKQVKRHLQPEISMSCNATQNNGVTSCLKDISLPQRVGETIASDENLSGFEIVQSSVPPGFCGFSTASGDQIHISRSAMQKARKTLSGVDIDMKDIVYDEGIKKSKKEQYFPMERGEGAPVNQLAPADNIDYDFGNKEEIPLLKKAKSDEPRLQEKCCTEPHRIASFSSSVTEAPVNGNDDPDFASAAFLLIEEKRENVLLKDHSKKNFSTIRAGETENKDLTLQSPAYVVGDSVNKHFENVNDSLLEDLLNDFKRKRRDSLIAISWESDKVEERELNTKSAVNNSCDVKHKHCNEKYSLECNGNVLKEILPEFAIDKSISVSKETTELCTKMQSGERIAPPTAFSGFQTASGQLVKLSAESMERGAVIMQQIDNSLQQNREATAPPHASSGLQTASGQLMKLSAESTEKGAAIIQQINNSLQQNRDTTAPANSFSGFQTASGHKVKLSEESMKKGAAIVHQIDESIQQNREITTPPNAFSGFQTASGHKVKLSEDSIEKGTAIAHQSDNSIQQNSETTAPPNAFSGFKTASGQRVKISAESMEKGAAILQQIDNSIQGNRETTAQPNAFSGFQTARGQRVKISAESMEKGAAIIQQIDNSIQGNRETTVPPNAFSGFQTASGQRVEISAESMEKGAAILQQIDNSVQGNRETTAPPNAFSAFQTASGHKVKLSEESMEKGAAIMQQIDNSIKHNRDTIAPPNAFSGFHTASGQQVNISAESLKKGAAIMQQIDNSLQQNMETTAPPNAFSGFQTASGQKVKLSKESVEKGAAIMQQIDDSFHRNKETTAPSTGFSDFQTAGGQKVKLSVESMKKGTVVMQEIDNFIHRDKEKVDQPLPRNIDGSESTNCFSECSANVSSASGFSGFQTANGKTVQISESALAKAKDTIASIENDVIKSRTGTEGVLNDSSFKGMDKWKLLNQDTDSAISDGHLVPAMFLGSSTPSRDGRCSNEQDDAVSREILESSEALLAYESSLDVSEYDKVTIAWDSLRTSPVSMTGSAKGLSSDSKEDFQRRHSTPQRCGEDMVNRNHRGTRSGLKPCSTTPSGVFHDRRVHLHAPLRARLATVENTFTPRGLDSTRSLNPLRATTPGCFKTKHIPSPRTSTPLNSNVMHRTSAPRPLFITPYRNREVSTVVSPLARCSSSSFPVSESPKPHITDLMEPSSKKAKLSSRNCSSVIKCGQPETSSKSKEGLKPRPGFLSGLRRHNKRIKLKDYVGSSTLPGRYTAAELLQIGVFPEVISVTSTNAVSFRFCGRKYFSETALSNGGGVRTEDGGVMLVGSDHCVGLEEIQSAFLTTPGVDSQLISKEWIANHYRWLVWKLAAMEVAFPHHFAGRCLTPDWLLCQLKYRYDREIDGSERSALKKITERDDVSSRTMVLCVSSVTVTQEDKEKNASEQSDDQGEKDGQSRMKMESCAIIEVTDDWYSIRAILDKPLTRLLHDKKIVVGQKLIVCGAELVGSEQAVSPLEAPSTLMLRLHANSTRRARWDVKLGFHHHTHAFPLLLSSLFGDGGFAGCVDIVVLRQYPVQWMEKMPDGTNVFRNSRLEERETKKFEADRHQRREKLFIKIQEEFERECLEPERERRRSARFRRRSFLPRDLKDLHGGKEIYEALTQATDPDAVKECLDERQMRALEEYQRASQEKKFAELQSKFERTWKEQEEEHQPQRNVVPLLKVRIADYLLKGRERQHAVLSIWRPSEEVMQLLSEGSRLRIYHLTASGVRYRQGVSELQLSATRTTRYQDLSSDPEVKSMVYVPRQVCSFHGLRFNYSQSSSEVDLVGLVIFCSPLSSFSSSSSNVQTVYLSDEESNIVAIKFWEGLKAVAVDDLIKAGNFICCSNLTVRPDDRAQCPSLTFWELSNVSLKPREPHLRAALHTLQQSIQDLRLFMSQIQEKLNFILHPNKASLPENLKVDAIRVHRQSLDITSSLCQNNGFISSKAKEVLHSSGKEIGPNLLAPSSSCADVKVSHQSDDPSLETPDPATHKVNSRAKRTRSKRKLLESIPEPPPLSPLPSLIPASVRREFKKPRRAENQGNIHSKQ